MVEKLLLEKRNSLFRMVTLEKSLILKEHFDELCISSIQILVVVYHIFLKSCTGHSFSKALILASINPKYDHRFVLRNSQIYTNCF